MEEIFNEVDLMFGQISSHKRLIRTIPHKAFEAAYYGIPYFTAQAPGVRELFSDTEAIFARELVVETLVEQLAELTSKDLQEISRLEKLKYEARASQRILGTNFLEIIDGLE
jgi:hypothetical protein